MAEEIIDQCRGRDGGIHHGLEGKHRRKVAQCPRLRELLPAPREGGADDLKLIKGVGPKLEGVLNEIGVYHYDQIAAWTDAEVAWADQNLVGFKGRVSRDDWVAQAKQLAAGEDTEFSQRAEKEGIYKDGQDK